MAKFKSLEQVEETLVNAIDTYTLPMSIKQDRPEFWTVLQDYIITGIFALNFHKPETFDKLNEKFSKEKSIVVIVNKTLFSNLSSNANLELVNEKGVTYLYDKKYDIVILKQTAKVLNIKIVSGKNHKLRILAEKQLIDYFSELPAALGKLENIKSEKDIKFLIKQLKVNNPIAVEE